MCRPPLAPRPSPLAPRPSTLECRIAYQPWSKACAAALAAWLLWPGLVFGSPAGALREYKDGKYDQALKQYQQLLERKGDDSRLHFNAGAAAYRGHQLDEAAKQFDEAANASDLRLQGMAYYNRGNTLYYLGEQDPDPSKRGEAWKKSISDFQNSLKLNPQDQDAKFNLQFVKKKLEELKQQQQQSQQNKSDQQQNQDQQQQQKQDQQNPKQDDQKQQQQQQQQDQQKQQDQSQQDQQSQQQKQDDQKQQQPAGQSQEQKQQEPKQSSGQPKESDEKDKEQQAAAVPAGQMTPQQAQQLLDSQKGEEMVLPANPKARPSDVRRPLKDW
ncbi:MAG: tetratricopeptide repeat protein [Verrucomicrobiota bacterium]